MDSTLDPIPTTQPESTNRLSLPSSFFVEALYPFNGEDTASLSFQKGDIIEVLTQLPSGWWDGVMWRQRERGWFPSNYTRRLTDEEAELTRAQLETIKQNNETIQNIQHPAQTNSNHPSRLSLLNNNNEQEQPESDSQPPPTSTTINTTPIQEQPSTDSQSIQPAPAPPSPSNNHSSNTTSNNSWAAWLPKVTDDGQIYYHNNLTGEIASEMPLADDDLDHPQAHSSLPPSSNSNPNSLDQHHINNSLSKFIAEDPLKFLQDHGFSRETLQKHGLISSSSSPASPTRLSNITQTSLSSPTPIPSNLNSSNLHSETNPSLGLNLPPTTTLLSPNDPSDSQPRTSSSSDLPELTSQTDDQLNVNRSSSSTTTTSNLLINAPSHQNIFQSSQQFKSQLKPIMEVPPTLSFSRMATEIKEAIGLLTKLTEPSLEDPAGPDYSSKNSNQDQMINQAHSQHARDELSRASINLVDKIRFLLQASCQLDTAVHSILNESHFAGQFNSLSVAQARRSSMSPISPFIPSRDSTLSAQYPAGSPFTSLFSNPHLNLPGLKHVSRKIASTLSKLTLSTRALWGLLSIRSADLFPPSLDDSASLDIQELNSRQNAQNRFALEQKLRSECRMGVSDLSTSVDAFFQHFEAILIEQSGSNSYATTRPTPPTRFFPRHGHGHLVMPIESVFLPGGAQGGNWKASGYHDPGHPMNALSEHSGPSMGGAQSPVSKRSVITPLVKLDSESLSARLLPLIRSTRELAETIISLLAVDADEILITSEPTELNCIERLSGETADQVMSQVMNLIEAVGHLLTIAESFDLGASLEVDLDPFIWLVLEQDQGLLKGLCDPIPEASLGNIHTRLAFARRLVGGYQRSKQALYDLVAELIYATQTLLTSSSGVSPPSASSIPSPAQPLSASPLFSLHPSSGFPSASGGSASPGKPLKTARRIVLALESLAVAAQAIVHQASTQNTGLDINLHAITQLFKNSIFVLQSTTSSSSNTTSTLVHHQHPSTAASSDSHSSDDNEDDGASSLSSSSDSFLPSHNNHPNYGNQAIPRRLKSNSIPHHPSSASASVLSPSSSLRLQNQNFSNQNLYNQNLPPPSPRHLLLSRGIEEEQAELELHLSGSSHPNLHRDNSIDGGSVTTRKREPSILVQDVDRAESVSSKSPTRSKKLAKFFGEEAATSVMPGPPKPMNSSNNNNATKPAFLMADYGPDDISFNVDNQIRGGTLKGLVIKLTSHEGPDVPFLRVFLMTYRTFTTSHDFLDLLIERYHQQPPAGLLAEELQLWTDQKQKVIKIRVINVIRSWIESHLSDEDADSIIQRVLEFSAHDMGDTNLARQVALTCERRQSRGGLNKMTPMQPPGNPPPSIPPRNPRKIKFLDIDPLELARQLSLVESKLFCQIQANECLGKAWPKEFAKEGTPNIKAMIDMSNALTRWVAETILLQPEQKKRASTIKHFILVADRCRSLNNFSTLMQIIAGLNSTPIYRLRRTWETIPQKTLTLFAQLGAVMSPTKNYAAYRDTIRNMAPPCVPFVGVYLTDWTFIGDGNPDQLREKPQQINFNKRQKAAELIVQIQSYQSMPYQLSPMPMIVKFLEESLENPRDEKELYDLSLELEPRERDDEKIARLLAESGFL
ncbi:hypothetical protein PGT21_024616 [Puccinia graminis f. sp. tritici]|uniref:Cell division control protein 25 n=1 Tax=Puccinia graminis f. sp. tritici TaxID=56615 RepID=A0A5B0NLF0_PUCGR|nr:hypothetical protein PGT21_024616 [Puccinia graminis f. sp. tritici]